MVDVDNIKKTFDDYFQCNESIVINSDGTISTKGYVTLMLHVKKLPVGFYEVEGFDVGGMGLTSLQGSPKYVYNEFRCNENNLQTLEGGPDAVGEHYLCGFNQLKSLQGAPKKVLGSLSCVGNPLESLEGIPQEGLGRIALQYSPTLPLLRALVAKKIVFMHRVDESEPPQKVQEIMNKYAGQGKAAMFDCQKDLEDSGFEGNARW